MKKLFKKILPYFIAISLVTISAHATTIFTVPQGGSGTGSITGIIKGNGTSPFSVATPGTDYIAPSGTLTQNSVLIAGSGGTVSQDNPAFTYTNALGLHVGLTPGTSNSNVGGYGLEVIGSNNTVGGVNLIVGNKNSGTSAFSDLFLQNDLANTAGTHYGVLNYSSSTYNDTTFGTLLASPSQIALYGTDGNTIVGTAKVGGTVQFFTGGTATGNVRLTISDTGISAVVPATFTQGFVATGQASNTISRTAVPAGLNGIFNILSQTQVTGAVNTTNGGFYNEFTINFNSTGSNNYAFTNTAGTGAMGLGGSTAAIAGYVQVSNSGSLTDSQVFPALFSLSGAGNITTAVGFRSVTSTATSTGRITNHEGFRAEDQTLTSVVSTNVYGFRGRISSGTNKYNLFMDGTAQNYFAGNLGIGVTVPAASLDILAGTTSLAPIHLNSGSLLSSPIAGSLEYSVDKAYVTISTGAARKEFALWDAAGTSGRVPYETTNGRLTDITGFTFDGANLFVPTNITAGSIIAGATGSFTTVKSTAVYAGTALITGNTTLTTTSARNEDVNTSSPITVTLPTAAGNDGLTFSIKNIGVSPLTIATATGAQQIDPGLAGGGTTITFNAPAASEIVARASNWYIH